MTMLRFAGKKGRRLPGPGRVYRRADGTVTRFFAARHVQQLFEEAGFVTVRCGYECRELKNRKTKIKMYRNWVSCVFIKPSV